MNINFYQGVLPVLTLIMLLFTAPTFSIDGDYVTPYAENSAISQCAQDDQECINSRSAVSRQGDSELPVATLLGSGLLLLGTVAVVVWKVREKKDIPKSQSDMRD